MSEEQIDVSKIMWEIRGRVEKQPAESWEVPSPTPAAGEENSVKWRECADSLQYVEEHYEIPYYWDFGPFNLKNLLKKLVRRVNKCLLAPLVAAQNQVNRHIVQCLRVMHEAAVSWHTRGVSYERRIAALEEEVRELRRYVNASAEALLEHGRTQIEQMHTGVQE